MPLLLLGLSALLLAALSWGRFLVLSEIAPDHAHLPPLLAGVAAAMVTFAIGLAWYGHRLLLRELDAGAGPGGLALRRAALLVAALSAAALPLLSNDLFSVLAYTDLAWATGVDPFILPRPGLRASRFFAQVSPMWRWAPCVYGPVQLAAWAPALADDVLAAVFRAKLVALAAHVGLVWALHACCFPRGAPATRQGDARRQAAFALAALSPVLWIEGAGQAHGDLLAALFLALWLLAARRGFSPAAGVALALAVACKLTALLPAGVWFVYLLRPRGRSLGRALLRAGGSAITFAATLVAAYAPFWRDLWTLRVPLRALAARWPTHTVFDALFQLGDGLGLPPRGMLPAVNGSSTVLSLAVALLAAAGAWRARRFSEMVATASAASFLAATLAAPVFHPWYLLPALVLAVELRHPAWRRWVVAAGLLCLLDVPVLLPVGTERHLLLRVGTLSLACTLAVWDLGARTRVLLPARRGA